MVTARKRKEGGDRGSCDHGGTTKPSLCTPPVLALSLGHLSLQSREQTAGSCALSGGCCLYSNLPWQTQYPPLSHPYNLPRLKIDILQGFRLLLPVITPSSTWQLWTSVSYATSASYSPASSLRTGLIRREKLPLRKAESWTDTRGLMGSAVFRRPEYPTSSTTCGSWWALGAGEVSGLCQRQR